MSDINLLPENFRKEEEKIRSSQNKDSVSFHIPVENKVNQPVKLAEPEDIFSGRAEIKPEPPAGKILNEVAKPVQLAPKFKIQPLVQKEFKINESPKNSGVIKERPGFLKKLFGRKQAQGKILANKLDKNDGNFSAGDEFDVNLIPEGSDLIPNKKLYYYFIIAGLAAFLVVALVMLVITVVEKKLFSQNENVLLRLSESKKMYEQLAAKEIEAIAWDKKVNLVKNILANHVYWIKFLNELEKITLPEVYYSGIQAATDGVVILEASADSYNSVAKQYLVYQQAENIFDEVNILEIAGDAAKGVINFEVYLVLNNQALYAIDN